MESVDMTDSKSVAPRACGFESHRRHQFPRRENMTKLIRYAIKGAVAYFIISILASNPQILKQLKSTFDNLIVGTLNVI